jgi:hypothetical protein
LMPEKVAMEGKDKDAPRCRREHAPGQGCLRDPVPGTTLCRGHTCPTCKEEKQSTAAACAKCANSGDAPPGEGKAAVGETCAHVGERGKCGGARVPDSNFCPAHRCPKCGAGKASNAKGCPTHLDAAAAAVPMVPCTEHEWHDAPLGSTVLKPCAICDKKLIGVKTLKCKNCDAKAHKKCATGAE